MSRPTHTQQRGLIYLAAALALALAAVVAGWPRQAAEPATPAADTAAVPPATAPAATHQPAPAGSRRAAAGSKPAQVQAVTTPPPPKRAPLVVDINTADTLTLQLLHGIGPVYARRIVAYRNRLGGFVSTNQLLEVYGLSPELYQHILPHITLGSGNLRRININTVPLKQLIRHPYIDYYQARDLVALRQQGVRYATVHDLLLSPTMDTATLQRLAPYINCEPDTIK